MVVICEYDVNPDIFVLYREYIYTRDILYDVSKCLHEINLKIVHGDLTTSNMIVLKEESTVALIDFGLAGGKVSMEAMAVDLYVLERAIASTHAGSEGLWACFLASYVASNVKDGVKVQKQYNKVSQRGRKRRAEAIG